jgi:hypothetical protein
MAELYIPKPMNLLGTYQQLNQLKRSQQQIDLMGQNLELRTKEYEQRKKKEKSDILVSQLGVPNQSKEYYQATVNKITGLWGLDELSLGDNYGDALREINGLFKAAKKNPSLDMSDAIDSIYKKYGGSERIRKEIDVLGVNIEKEKLTQADQYISLIQGSGGIAQGQQENLLRSFSEQGGTPQLRAVATARLTQRKGIEVPKQNEIVPPAVAAEIGIPKGSRLTYGQAASAGYKVPPAKEEKEVEIKVPDRVVKAQDFVKSIASKLAIDPLTAMMYSKNPEKLKLLKPDLPADVISAFNQAAKIVDEYYKERPEEAFAGSATLEPSHPSSFGSAGAEDIDPFGIFEEEGF